MPATSPVDRERPWQVARLLVLILALTAAALLLWQLAHVLLLVFAAILVAVLIRAAAGLIERLAPRSGRWSVALACLLIGAVLAGFLYLMGAQIRAQAMVLAEDLPDLIAAAEDRLGVDGLDELARERIGAIAQDSSLATSVAGTSATVAEAVATTFIVLVAGLYLALSPRTYRDGLLRLVPPPRQPEARGTLDAVGRALSLWLLGQLLAMVLVGVLTTLGLWALGLPSALALGALAGLLEFVPFLGPVLSAVPAVALALGEGLDSTLWVIALYVAIQQVEGALITPLVQQRTVDLPPALTIFAILAFGVLFGPLGILLATPLTVVCFVLVKKLWVREVLEEDTELPGEEAGRAEEG